MDVQQIILFKQLLITVSDLSATVSELKKSTQEALSDARKATEEALKNHATSFGVAIAAARTEASDSLSEIKALMAKYAEDQVGVYSRLEGLADSAAANKAATEESIAQLRTVVGESADSVSSSIKAISESMASIQKEAEARYEEVNRKVESAAEQASSLAEQYEQRVSEYVARTDARQAEAADRSAESLDRATKAVTERLEALDRDVTERINHSVDGIRKSTEERIVVFCDAADRSLSGIQKQYESAVTIVGSALEKMEAASSRIDDIEKGKDAFEERVKRAVAEAGDTLDGELAKLKDAVGDTAARDKVLHDLFTKHSEATLQKISMLASDITEVKALNETAISGLAESIKSLSTPEPFNPTPLIERILEIDERVKGLPTPMSEDQIKALIPAPTPAPEIVLPEPFNPAPLFERIEELSETVKSLPTPLSEDQIKALIPPAPAAIELPEPFNPTPLAERIEALSAEIKRIPVVDVNELHVEISNKAQEAFDAVKNELKVVAKEAVEASMPQPSELVALEAAPPQIDVSVDEGEDGNLYLVVGDSRKRIDGIPKWEGIYRKDRDYRRGALVTHDGCLWTAVKNNPGTPKDDLVGWRLCVKAGRDGRPGAEIRTYDGHKDGQQYARGDFLRIYGRLWQANTKTTTPPEGASQGSSEEWLMVGYAM